MDVIKINKNEIEKYHVYKIIKYILYMNDTSIDTYNPIFEALHQIAQMPHSPV
jgi:hypothetical protein